MKWVKVTIKDRSGLDSVEYRLGEETNLRKINDYLTDYYDAKNFYNDGYRGIDCEFIGAPPIEWLEKEQKRVMEKVGEYARYYHELKRASSSVVIA